MVFVVVTNELCRTIVGKIPVSAMSCAGRQVVRQKRST
jgi:hypothetical protein